MVTAVRDPHNSSIINTSRKLATHVSTLYMPFECHRTIGVSQC